MPGNLYRPVGAGVFRTSLLFGRHALWHDRFTNGHVNPSSCILLVQDLDAADQSTYTDSVAGRDGSLRR